MDWATLLNEFKSDYKLYVDNLTGSTFGSYPLYTAIEVDNLITDKLKEAYGFLKQVLRDNLNLLLMNPETKEFIEEQIKQYTLGSILIITGKTEAGVKLQSSVKSNIFDLIQNTTSLDNYIFDIDELIN